MQVKLHILDEINCKIEGLAPEHLEAIINATKFTVKGSFHSAAFKLDLWDGKESFLDEEGNTFQFFLNRVLPIIVEYGYDVDLLDYRTPPEKKPNHIDNSLFIEHGIELRDYQIETVNNIIDNDKGLIDIATSGGKTNICAAIAKVYDKVYRTIVIVPNENLVTQTQKVFKSVGLDAGKISGKISAKKKLKEWEKRHVITTWQTLNRNRKHLHNFNILLYDETHIMGDTMFDVLSHELAHAHVRVGFSGSIPKDKHKREKIMCYIGGDVLYSVKPKQLQDDGYISTCDITLIPIHHQITLPDEEWDSESKYLNMNQHRIQTVADFIKELITVSPENTLILTHPQFGRKLATILQSDFIDDEVDTDIRDSYYEKFVNEKSDYVLTATYGTVGTGTSINDIRRLIMIDAGPNETRILQAIGRGLRLDGKENHLQVFDFYSKLFKMNDRNIEVEYSYSGGNHVRDRKKIYRENKYPYVELEGIEVYE